MQHRARGRSRVIGPLGAAPMKYVFQFGIVWDHLPRLIDGAWLTLRLSVGAFVLGFALAVLLAYAAHVGTALGADRGDGVRRVHPQHAVPGAALRHLFFAAGDRHPLRGGHRGADRHERSISQAMRPRSCASGIEAVPRSQIEAGHSLGFTRLSDLRHIIVFPALRTVYPALASQFVLLMLGSSIVAAISVEELTGSHQHAAVDDVPLRSSSTSSPPAMYLALAIGARLLLDARVLGGLRARAAGREGWAR